MPGCVSSCIMANIGSPHPPPLTHTHVHTCMYYCIGTSYELSYGLLGLLLSTFILLTLVLSLFGVHVCHGKLKKKHKHLQRTLMTNTHIHDNQSYGILQRGVKERDSEDQALNAQPPHAYDYIHCTSQVSAVVNSKQQQKVNVQITNNLGSQSDIYDYIDDQHFETSTGPGGDHLTLEATVYTELEQPSSTQNVDHELDTPVFEDPDISSDQSEHYRLKPNSAYAATDENVQQQLSTQNLEQPTMFAVAEKAEAKIGQSVRLEANSVYAVPYENEPTPVHVDQATHVVDDTEARGEYIRLEVNVAYAAPYENEQLSPTRNFEQTHTQVVAESEARAEQSEDVCLEANSAYAVLSESEPVRQLSIEQAVLLVIPVAEELGDGFGHR